MALTITEANAVNVLLRHVMNLPGQTGPSSPEAVVKAAALLAEHAHNTLHAGLFDSRVLTSYWARGHMGVTL